MTVESHCQFIDRIHDFLSYIDHHAILHTRQESLSYDRLVLQLCDADRASDIRPERIIQIHHQLVGRLPHLPDVPPLNRTVGGRREELRVGLGLDPERLVRRVSFARRRRETGEETGVTEITIWQRNGTLFGNILPRRRQKLRPRLRNEYELQHSVTLIGCELLYKQ